MAEVFRPGWRENSVVLSYPAIHQGVTNRSNEQGLQPRYCETILALKIGIRQA
jgi:hypothetical protein